MLLSSIYVFIFIGLLRTSFGMYDGVLLKYEDIFRVVFNENFGLHFVDLLTNLHLGHSI